jgi:hypothetical protein
MLRFEPSTTDYVERQFFGRIDVQGTNAVDVFSRISGYNPEVAQSFDKLALYMGAQGFRTPRGLDFLKEHVQATDSNRPLFGMREVFQQHTTMWTEGVWEIVSAANSPTKFIISDDPITFYNQVLYPGKTKYPGIEDLPSVGTRTLFPLGPDSCLIITHLEYVRDPRIPSDRIRVNARQYDNTMMYMGNIQFGRHLEESEVQRVRR